MKHRVITLIGNELSETAAARCIQSSNKVGNKFDIEIYEAVTPVMVGDIMRKYDVEWKYPWEGVEVDFSTGLQKSAYATRDPLRRIACAMSHYDLWEKCVQDNEPYMILEHDALWVNKIDLKLFDTNKFNIVGLNDPIGATRKAHDLKEAIIKKDGDIIPIPTVDDLKIPQGLAGNSAYIIKPAGAKHVIKAVKEYGLWPNDAIMCKQLIPRMGVTRKFYTRVQGTVSTTVN